MGGVAAAAEPMDEYGWADESLLGLGERWFHFLCLLLAMFFCNLYWCILFCISCIKMYNIILCYRHDMKMGASHLDHKF